MTIFEVNKFSGEVTPFAPIRVLSDPPGEGAWNMALDEALLHSVSSGRAPDTLRFYRWSKPTLSLGYFQRLEERQGHSFSLSCPVIRRSSGGGAILHDQELTYSLAMRVGDRFASRELYDLVHQSLIEVLQQQWSIEASLVAAEAATAKSGEFLCFLRRSEGDVVSRDFKVCGSAQRRFGSAVLQHGSLLLSRSRHAPELPGLSDLWETTVNDSHVEKMWKNGLLSRLNRRSDEGAWLAEELAEAERWQRERFGEAGWLGRR